MHDALPYLIAVQGVVTLLLSVMVFGLARQIGVLHERLAPMGAMTSDQGPEVGERAPSLLVTAMAGDSLRLDGANPSGRSRLLLFVSASCPICKKLLPIARSFARAEHIDVVLVSDGEPAELTGMIEKFALEDLPFVNSAQVGLVYQVAKLPYAVLIGSDGFIRAKGLVNSREHLESLIIAEETGFGTIQAFLQARQRAAPAAPVPASAAPSPPDLAGAGTGRAMRPISRGRFDRLVEVLTRTTAQRTSRRCFIQRCGAWLVVPSALPLLPVSRRAQAADPAPRKASRKFASAFANQAQTTDPTQCNYWRYCSSDGYLCACCGGGPNTCPPGTTPSPTSWVGSCINPDDGKTYLIAYRDCCGQDSCGRCSCLGQEGDMPSYRPQVNNDIVWCFGASSMVYHCSSAGLVGLVE